MWSQRQTPRPSIAASETFGYQPGPTYGNRFRQDCLASQQPSWVVSAQSAQHRNSRTEVETLLRQRMRPEERELEHGGGVRRL